MKTHMRTPTYVLGIIIGAILYDYQRIKWRISTVCLSLSCLGFAICSQLNTRETIMFYILQFWSHILVIPLPVTLIIAYQSWSHKFLLNITDYSILKIAFFVSNQKIIPVLCISTIILVLSFGNRLGMISNQKVILMNNILYN